MSALSLFPQELLDAIVDSLDDDRPSMKACSLVCRAFRPYATARLFYELDLRSTLYSSMQWSKFHKLCLSSPHIPLTFRKLHLSFFHIHAGAGLAVIVLRMLKNVEILVMSVTPPVNLSPYLKSTLASMPIMHFTAENMQIRVKADFLLLLNECLPQMKTLSFLNVTCSDTEEKYRPITRTCLLENLVVLGERPMPEVLDAIADGYIGQLDELRYLRLGVAADGDPAFGRLIQLESVRNINLAPKGFIPPAKIMGDAINIHHLHDIILHIQDLPWLVACLSNPPPWTSALRRIRINARQYSEQDALLAALWAQLDDRLSQSHMTSLHTIQLWRCSDSAWTGICACCPQLLKAGVLQRHSVAPKRPIRNKD
ncbi:hypothetical protein BDZ89DRAFT_1076489, partial [Hymenopellis radicata]